MAKLRKLFKKRLCLESDLEQFAEEIANCEGSYSEHIVAGEYDRTVQKLKKVNTKIESLIGSDTEVEIQAARYRWLRDNRHLDIWRSVQGPKEIGANIDADIDTARGDDNSTFYNQVDKWRDDSEELEIINSCLDDFNVPRFDNGEELSPWGRIFRFTSPLTGVDKAGWR